jgi:hypothetical protein
MQWFADSGFTVITLDDEGFKQVKPREKIMDAATLKRYLNNIEEAIGQAEEQELDVQELGDEVIRIVNEMRSKLREEER